LISEKQNGEEGKDTGNETEGDTSDNNSDQSNSDSNEDSGSDKGENTNINELPENIQAIARLPLPQAQQKTEQEIEKLLKENGISEQELNQDSLLKGTN